MVLRPGILNIDIGSRAVAAGGFGEVHRSLLEGGQAVAIKVLKVFGRSDLARLLEVLTRVSIHLPDNH